MKLRMLLEKVGFDKSEIKKVNHIICDVWDDHIGSGKAVEKILKHKVSTLQFSFDDDIESYVDDIENEIKHWKPTSSKKLNSIFTKVKKDFIANITTAIKGEGYNIKVDLDFVSFTSGDSDDDLEFAKGIVAREEMNWMPKIIITQNIIK